MPKYGDLLFLVTLAIWSYFWTSQPKSFPCAPKWLYAIKYPQGRCGGPSTWGKTGVRGRFQGSRGTWDWSCGVMPGIEDNQINFRISNILKVCQQMLPDLVAVDHMSKPDLAQRLLRKSSFEIQSTYVYVAVMTSKAWPFYIQFYRIFPSPFWTHTFYGTSLSLSFLCYHL